MDLKNWSPNVEEEQLSDGRKVFVASHAALLGIMASGATEAEAREGFYENLADHLKDLKAAGLPYPSPTRYFFAVRLDSTDSAVVSDREQVTEGPRVLCLPRSA